MKLELVTPPASEPLTLVEAKTHLRVDVTEDDTLITSLITAARAMCETECRRCFVTQTWRQWMDAFPSIDIRPVATPQAARAGIELGRTPVASVSSVIYTDLDGTQQTLSPSLYQLDRIDDPAWLYPAYLQTWPATRDIPNAVQVQFVAGAEGAIDERVKMAMRLLIGHWYENREDSVTGKTNSAIQRGVAALLTQVWNGRLH